MKATELRLGNWVQDFGDGYGKVIGIYPDNPRDEEEADVLTTANPIPQPVYTFNPIPLTAEILGKAGVKVEYTNGGFLCWQKEDFKLLDRRLPYPQYHAPAAVITYLHQLQNLYFALTGEELNINL